MSADNPYETYEAWETAMGRAFESVPCNGGDAGGIVCTCNGCCVHLFWEDMSARERSFVFAAMVDEGFKWPVPHPTAADTAAAMRERLDGWEGKA